MNRLAPLLAYLPWHARDAWLRALTPVLIAGGVIGIPVYSFIGASDSVSVADRRGIELAMNVYDGGIPLALTLGAIILMNQVIALDRDKQYFRFTMAHPIAAWEFYLQRFLVGLVLFVAASAVIPLVFSALVVKVTVIGMIKSAALQGLLLGALAMLCGALVSKDGLALIVTYVVAQILQDLRKAEVLVSWLVPVAQSLPPVRLASSLRGDWLRGVPVESSDLLFVVSYSVAMIAAALFLVKRLPLAR